MKSKTKLSKDAQIEALTDERIWLRIALEDRDKLHSKHIQAYKLELLKMEAKLNISVEALERIAADRASDFANNNTLIACDALTKIKGIRSVLKRRKNTKERGG